MILQQVIRDETGVMLVEQLIAALLGLVVLGALYGFFRSQISVHLSQQVKSAAWEDGRGALDIIARDLKNAGSWGTGAPPPETGGVDDPDKDADLVCNRIYAATPNILHVQMDLNGNNTCADTEPRENIRYEIGGPTSTCPGSKTIRRNGDCLLANVSAEARDRLFTYFDAAGTDLGDTPHPVAIRRIRIGFVVETKNPDPRGHGSFTVELSTSVDLRN